MSLKPVSLCSLFVVRAGVSVHEVNLSVCLSVCQSVDLSVCRSSTEKRCCLRPPNSSVRLWTHWTPGRQWMSCGTVEGGFRCRQAGSQPAASYHVRDLFTSPVGCQPTQRSSVYVGSITMLLFFFTLILNPHRSLPWRLVLKTQAGIC